jgi:hypothetical protein
MMRSNIFLSFSLRGTATPPSEISAMTGIRPFTELLRGERDAGRDLPRSNLWTVRSTGWQSDSVARHWQTIERKLVAKTDVFRRLAAEGSAVLTIVVEGSDTRCPPIDIPPSMALFAGSIGAVLDIDHLQ